MLRQLDLTSTEWINLDWQMNSAGKTGGLPQAVSLTRPSSLTLILGASSPVRSLRAASITARRFPASTSRHWHLNSYAPNGLPAQTNRWKRQIAKSGITKKSAVQRPNQNGNNENKQEVLERPNHLLSNNYPLPREPLFRIVA
jgi:hypothetical protein